MTRGDNTTGTAGAAEFLGVSTDAVRRYATKGVVVRGTRFVLRSTVKVSYLQFALNDLREFKRLTSEARMSEPAVA